MRKNKFKGSREGWVRDMEKNIKAKEKKKRKCK